MDGRLDAFDATAWQSLVTRCAEMFEGDEFFLDMHYTQVQTEMDANFQTGPMSQYCGSVFRQPSSHADSADMQGRRPYLLMTT